MHNYDQMMASPQGLLARSQPMPPMHLDYQNMVDLSNMMMFPPSDTFIESHRTSKKHPQKTQLDLYKTRLCPLLAEGKCNNGDNCKFAHSESEIRTKPNLAKTKLCEEHLKGNCKLGQDCKYAHDESELRWTPDIYKTALCSSFAKGNCKNGDKCRFAHGNAELKEKPAHLVNGPFSQKKSSPHKKPPRNWPQNHMMNQFYPSPELFALYPQLMYLNPQMQMYLASGWPMQYLPNPYEQFANDQSTHGYGSVSKEAQSSSNQQVGSPQSSLGVNQDSAPLNLVPHSSSESEN